MSIQEIATSEEKQDLSSRLAFLYLEKTYTGDLSPEEFASKYFEVKSEIHKVVGSRSHL